MRRRGAARFQGGPAPRFSPRRSTAVFPDFTGKKACFSTDFPRGKGPRNSVIFLSNPVVFSQKSGIKNFFILPFSGIFDGPLPLFVYYYICAPAENNAFDLRFSSVLRADPPRFCILYYIVLRIAFARRRWIRARFCILFIYRRTLLFLSPGPPPIFDNPMKKQKTDSEFFF